MKIWAYVIAWNEENMLPYYLRHYSTFCDKIIVFDNMSTDKTREIAMEYSNQVGIEVIQFDTFGKMNDYTHIELKRYAQIHAKGQADFIILSDCDEFVYHPHIKEFLEQHKDCSVFYPAGFQMVSDYFPYGQPGQLYEYVKEGAPDPWYCKPIIINLNMIKGVEWVEGAHEIKLDIVLNKFYHPIPENIRPIGEYGGYPWGRWKKLYEITDQFNQIPLKMLHYKFLGFDYVNDRYRQYANKMSEDNIKNGVSMHYQDSINNNSILGQINKIKENSVIVNLK